MDSRALALGTVTPLRMIFWGGLLCVLDLTITLHGGVKFDILNDFVGKILIAVGVFRLSALPVTESYRRAFRFLKAVSVISAIRTLTRQFPHDAGTAESLAGSVCSLLDMTGMVVFCVTMQLLCRVSGLEATLQSWKTTTLLLIAFLALPMGIIQSLATISNLTGRSINLEPGGLGILLLVLVFIPMIHLFVSTSRMKRAAQDLE